MTRDPIEALTDQPYQYAHGDPLDEIDPSGLGCGWTSPLDCASDVGGAIGDAAVWAYKHPATVGLAVGAVALAATGVGAVADAGIVAGIGAGEGLAAGAAEVGGAAAVDVSEEAAVAVGGNAWNTAANALNWTSYGIGGFGTTKTCLQEGFSSNCDAGIAFGIGGLATTGAGYLAGDFPWLFWGNAFLGLGYGVAGERDFNCGGWHLA